MENLRLRGHMPIGGINVEESKLCSVSSKISDES
jgi:hypothetical protein